MNMEADNQPEINLKDITIEDCGDSLEVLDEKDFILQPMYFEWKFSDTSIMKLRSGLVDRLRKAQENLRKITGCEDWRIKIWDGYRTLKTQQLLYIEYFNRLKVAHPTLSDDEIKSKVEIFVSFPSYDPSKPPPHNTGGAVDLTLVDAEGRDVPMGTAFDEFDENSFTDHFSSEGGQFHENRMHLKGIMEEVGFKNYHEEWWHFSYGDQGWAMQTGADEAIYGSMEI